MKHLAQVQSYTLKFFRRSPDPLWTRSLLARSAGEAVRMAGEVLAAEVGATRTSAALTLGRGPDVENLEWLGAWDWDGRELVWRPED